jgi:uncharacterized protein Yka (UPF0111/DUF47 family)
MRLLPRSEKFFTFFLEQVKVICESAAALHEAVKQGHPHLSQAEPVVRALEQKGDEIIHEIFTRLNSTFITPLDREDKPLLEHCIEINRLEGAADEIVRRAIAELFRSEKDPIQLIKLKEVYEIIESTTDYCEDVVDVLQGVVVKNS